jgi:SAM-dependent methyltransferase
MAGYGSKVRRRLAAGAFALALLCVVSTWLHWPSDDDRNAGPWLEMASKEFYTQAYSSADELRYQEIARIAAEDARITERVQDFVRQFHLEKARILDVGAGRGYLQDVVDDYVGLDISPAARQFFHKPFVEASATSMPFGDNSFDAVWSIWVLEHIPEPEKALAEIRRVTKPGGYLFLFPAWNCTPWAASGYDVRPYEDFGWKDKLIKASVPIRKSPAFKASYLPPRRLATGLAASWSGGPTTLRYSRLEPNFARYWTNDSDAVVSIDWYEALLWFTSRGDECVGCSGWRDIFRRSSLTPLVVRVNK